MTVLQGELETSPLQDQTGEYGQMSWFDPGAVLQVYYAANPAMQALCAQYLPPGSTEWSAYRLDSEWNDANLARWECLQLGQVGESILSEYLQGFASAVWVCQKFGFDLPCCVGNDGTNQECNPDILEAMVLPPVQTSAPLVFNLEASDIVAALQTADEGEVQQLQQILGIIPLTCEAITNAIVEADDGDQKNFAVATVNSMFKPDAGGAIALGLWVASQFIPVWGELFDTEVFLEWFTETALPFIEKYFSLSIICDPDQPPGFSWSVNVIPPQFVLTWNLQGLFDCGEPLQVEQENVPVRYFTCGTGAAEQTFEVPSLVGPAGETWQGVLQLLVDKLQSLQECCRPCPCNAVELLTDVAGVGNATFPGISDEHEVYEIEIFVTAQKAQGASDFSNPPRWKYGTFSWVYADGTCSHPQFLNYTGERFANPLPFAPAVGINWHFEPDVVVQINGCWQSTVQQPVTYI